MCVHMCIVAYSSLGAYKWPNDRWISANLQSHEKSQRSFPGWSDNAKIFKVASREIKKLYDQLKSQSQSLWDTLDQDQIKSELSAKGIKRRFIAERTPRRDGWWGRFCRAVKEPLRTSLLQRAEYTSHQE